MAKLTRELLNPLHKGNAAIALKPVTGGAVDFSTLDFSDADLLYSIKGTFSITQDDPEVSELKIDQGDAVIDTTTEAGAITITGSYPTIAEDAFAYFYKEGIAVTAMKGPSTGAGATSATYAGKSFFNTPKQIEASLLAQSQDESTAIAFARVQMTVVMRQDNEDQPFYLAVTGKVLTNLKEGEGDFVVLKKQ
jgi:hypothetical protein